MEQPQDERHEAGHGRQRPGDPPSAFHEQIVQTLLDERRTLQEPLQPLRDRLDAAERDRDAARYQLALVLNSRKYRCAQRLAKILFCLRHPHQGLPLVARKLRSLRPKALLRRGYDRMPAALRAPIRAAYHGLKGSPPPAPAVPAPAAAPVEPAHAIPAPHFKRATAAPDRRVVIVIHQFFNQQGENMFFGGAERYLIELARLIRDLGYEPEVYQSGAGDWVRHYNDLRVIGLDTGGDWSRINEVFHERVGEGLLTIYLAFFLAAPRCHARSLGISHGVFWDQEHFDCRGRSREEGLKAILQAMHNVATMVTVDTSTTNWVRGTIPDLSNKFVYIPNFVDTDEYHPETEARRPDRVVVLYPRRLCDYRGFWLVHDVLPAIMEQFPHVDFRFVGKADVREEEAVRGFIERYPGRIAWYFLPPERMAEAYRGVDLAVVPTLHSEGTSLSCLEAMASGVPVIATSIGGLSDLILHDYNGLLIEPTAAHLRAAITRLVTDTELRLRLGRRGTLVAQSFGLERWRRQWAEIIEVHCATPAPRVDDPLRTCADGV
jgi:glycosyltransferase involved in cell wall biosynthesis